MKFVNVVNHTFSICVLVQAQGRDNTAQAAQWAVKSEIFVGRYVSLHPYTLSLNLWLSCTIPLHQDERTVGVQPPPPELPPSCALIILVPKAARLPVAVLMSVAML